LLRERTSQTRTRHLPVSDTRNFTTLEFVYDTTEVIVSPLPGSSKQFKALRPQDEQIARFYRTAKKFWDLLVVNVTAVRRVARTRPEAGAAGEFRHRDGGHLVFRPVGLLTFARVVRALVDTGVSLDDAVTRVSHVPMDLAAEPWSGLLWDNTNHRMITATPNQRAAGWLMFHAVGGDLGTSGTILGRRGTTTDRLRVELAGLTNRQVEQVVLPRYAG
jgi:DNA sulfur modification protein DndB